MPFDFPGSPALNDTFTDPSTGAVYKWNGYAWIGGVPGLSGYLPLAGGVMTGPLTPAPVPGIVGVTDGSNAAAGAVGEVLSVNQTTPQALSNNVAGNVASLSLTPGDWDVSGEVWFAGTTAATTAAAALGTTSATFPTATALNTSRTQILTSVPGIQILSLRPCRVNITTPTTYYLIGIQAYTAGACTATGNIIARRAR